ncbi:MAG: hypothetical protein RLZZ419_918 [Pseudomonadota bacterium]|jgi:glycosyltransferase involved in cell wall biosynthesis
MTTNALISIVLPTYNGSRYLEQAIQSCLDQTYQNWELIIVDDASTDKTPALITQFANADSRIRTIRHETNRKLPAALNTGFAEAKGDYLTWTSDDNCYRPQALAAMVAFLESHPFVNIVYSDFTTIDEEGQLLEFITVSQSDRLAIHNCIGPCFLYQRQVYETVGTYSENLFLVEDYDFWLRASVSFQLEPLHLDLYLYRYHATSLTSQQSEAISIATENVLAQCLPQLHWVNNTMRASGYLRLSGLARGRKAMIAGCYYLLYAMFYSPLLALQQTAHLVLRRISRFAHFKYQSVITPIDK